MTGIPMILAFLVAIVIMIVAISKFKIHPFLSIMAVSRRFSCYPCSCTKENTT